MADKTTKGIIDKADGVLVEVYKDAASPMIKPIGEILGFLPRTLKLAFSGWEKWLINGEETIRLTAESVRKKVKNIPEEKLVEPESYVAIPAMQQLSYCVNNEELRELYANLLVSSMNADKKWQVHPAFVDLIKQLTPDEARLLKALTPTVIIVNPLIDVQLVHNGDQGYYDLFTNFTTVGIDKIDKPDNICAYIDNLERLKLISVSSTKIMKDISEYQDIETSELLHKRLPNNMPSVEFKIHFKHKSFSITNFGIDFINICCN